MTRRLDPVHYAMAVADIVGTAITSDWWADANEEEAKAGLAIATDAFDRALRTQGILVTDALDEPAVEPDPR